MVLTTAEQGWNGSLMIIRREHDGDAATIHAVTAAAFASAEHSAPPTEPGGEPGEVALVTQLRADAGWLPELSLVAVEGGVVIGHVVATRAYVDDQPALGLGPLSVLPANQGKGVGSSLMHAVLGAAEARGESLAGLLGEPAYYRRFGFVPASGLGVIAPDLSWGDYFQVRTLAGFTGAIGVFRYAKPFQAL